jgi:hypothetical protein
MVIYIKDKTEFFAFYYVLFIVENVTRELTRGKTRVTGWKVDSSRSQKNN